MVTTSPPPKVRQQPDTIPDNKEWQTIICEMAEVCTTGLHSYWPVEFSKIVKHKNHSCAVEHYIARTMEVLFLEKKGEIVKAFACLNKLLLESVDLKNPHENLEFKSYTDLVLGVLCVREGMLDDAKLLLTRSLNNNANLPKPLIKKGVMCYLECFIEDPSTLDKNHPIFTLITKRFSGQELKDLNHSISLRKIEITAIYYEDISALVRASLSHITLPNKRNLSQTSDLSRACLSLFQSRTGTSQGPARGNRYCVASQIANLNKQTKLRILSTAIATGTFEDLPARDRKLISNSTLEQFENKALSHEFIVDYIIDLNCTNKNDLLLEINRLTKSEQQQQISTDLFNRKIAYIVGELRGNLTTLNLLYDALKSTSPTTENHENIVRSINTANFNLAALSVLLFFISSSKEHIHYNTTKIGLEEQLNEAFSNQKTSFRYPPSTYTLNMESSEYKRHRIIVDSRTTTSLFFLLARYCFFVSGQSGRTTIEIVGSNAASKTRLKFNIYTQTSNRLNEISDYHEIDLIWSLVTDLVSTLDFTIYKAEFATSYELTLIFH